MREMTTQYPWEDPAGWYRACRGLPEEPYVYIDIAAGDWPNLPELLAQVQAKIDSGQLVPMPPQDKIPRHPEPLFLRVVVGGATVLSVPLKEVLAHWEPCCPYGSGVCWLQRKSRGS